MVDLLIGGVEEEVFRRLQARAGAAGITVEDLAREILRARSLPDEKEASAALERLRNLSPKELRAEIARR